MSLGSAAQHHYIKIHCNVEGRFVETWYDRGTTSWVTQTKDENFNQIDEAIYTGNQDSAKFAHEAACNALLRELPIDQKPTVFARLK